MPVMKLLASRQPVPEAGAGVCSLPRLPSPVLQHLLHFLPPCDIARCEMTCKDMHEECAQWAGWQAAVAHDFGVSHKLLTKDYTSRHVSQRPEGAVPMRRNVLRLTPRPREARQALREGTDYRAMYTRLCDAREDEWFDKAREQDKLSRIDKRNNWRLFFDVLVGFLPIWLFPLGCIVVCQALVLYTMMDVSAPGSWRAWLLQCMVSGSFKLMYAAIAIPAVCLMFTAIVSYIWSGPLSTLGAQHADHAGSMPWLMWVIAFKSGRQERPLSARSATRIVVLLSLTFLTWNVFMTAASAVPTYFTSTPSLDLVTVGFSVWLLGILLYLSSFTVFLPGIRATLRWSKRETQYTMLAAAAVPATLLFITFSAMAYSPGHWSTPDAAEAGSASGAVPGPLFRQWAANLSYVCWKYYGLQLSVLLNTLEWAVVLVVLGRWLARRAPMDGGTILRSGERSAVYLVVCGSFVWWNVFGLPQHRAGLLTFLFIESMLLYFAAMMMQFTIAATVGYWLMLRRSRFPHGTNHFFHLFPCCRTPSMFPKSTRRLSA